MKLRRKSLAVAAGIVLALGIPVLVLFSRSPVLIITDFSFISIYGENRIRLEALQSSLELFRPVKPVVIADEAGEDILLFAVTQASSRPYCVIFPLRFAGTAKLYREQRPETPVVLLEGRFPVDTGNPAAFSIPGYNSGDYYIYTTDIDADFYLAGVAAAALDGDKNGTVVVFCDYLIQREAREALLRGLNARNKYLETHFFNSFSQYSAISDLSCVILAGSGAEYLEKSSEIPVIYFTWLDPSLLPNDVTLVFNDSPWVQAVPAVRMAAAGTTKGRIQSKMKNIPAGKTSKDYSLTPKDFRTKSLKRQQMI
ncbi:MAG: hypothetical protein LBH44_11910 [Treponema sp.]|jgi:hypothetical protein|nr:hypothetical protein [Treponema sp.]